MPTLEIHQLACRSDNFAVLLHDAASGETVLIDAPEAGPIEAALVERGWHLSHILVTHHHMDHVAGIAPLKAAYGCTVIGPSKEAQRIPSLDRAVADGDRLSLCDTEVAVIATPGHTLGQVAYHLPQQQIAFTGDTLFSMGCGRVFEGSMAQMWASLDRLRQLPPQTAIYCGHEYTLSNARFAASLEPQNAALRDRLREVEALRQSGLPTLPTNIALELATNPFLRVDIPAVQASIGMSGRSLVEVFGEMRRRKDMA